MATAILFLNLGLTMVGIYTKVNSQFALPSPHASCDLGLVIDTGVRRRPTARGAAMSADKIT